MPTINYALLLTYSSFSPSHYQSRSNGSGLIIILLSSVLFSIIAIIATARRNAKARERLIERQRQMEREKDERRIERELERDRKHMEKYQEAQKARRERELKAQEEKARREKEAEAARIEKEKNMDEQRRFVAQQRRLMTDRLRYEVMSRDGFRCQICGATAQDGYKLHVDHIYPVSKGGKTELSNLRTLCERCNMGKSDKIETAVPEPPAVNLSKSDFASIDDLVQALKSRQIEYIDNRSKGGCLWVKSTLANDPFLLSVTVAGVHLIYVDSVRRFKNFGGYYIKPQ